MAQARYFWPEHPFSESMGWRVSPEGGSWVRTLEESPESLRHDSRWPAFFPSAIAVATAYDGSREVLERIVGASVVNRFPYVVALSVCRTDLSARHHARRSFMAVLERRGEVALQFFEPGPALGRVLSSVADVPEIRSDSRVAYTGLATRGGVTNSAPIFNDAYMAYECRLAAPSRDIEGTAIFKDSWVDVGSHRVYFVEVRAIQLKREIATGHQQIHWQSLPDWRATGRGEPGRNVDTLSQTPTRFQKTYTPFYRYPSRGTQPFEFDDIVGEMAVKSLPSESARQVEQDNDRARWPCFFPSSVGMISTWASDGVPNLMPCGSTTIVSRNPWVVAPCVSYAAINDRYAPRATLELIRKNGRFGCGVPFVHRSVVDAIRYCGNTSFATDSAKVRHCDLETIEGAGSPMFTTFPVQFDCEVIGEHRLGTHVMFLGQVRTIRVRRDVTPRNPLGWSPWAAVKPLDDQAPKEVDSRASLDTLSAVGAF